MDFGLFWASAVFPFLGVSICLIEIKIVAQVFPLTPYLSAFGLISANLPLLCHGPWRPWFVRALSIAFFTGQSGLHKVQSDGRKSKAAGIS